MRLLPIKKTQLGKPNLKIIKHKPKPKTPRGNNANCLLSEVKNAPTKNINRMKKYQEQIKCLQYRTIEQGFYEVYASDDWNILIEGNVCLEFLNCLIEKAKKDKAKISKVKGKSKDEWDFLSNTQKIQKENSELKRELKKYKDKIHKIKRLT